MTELKPCPFCGCYATISDRTWCKKYWAKCTYCTASVWGQTIEKAIEQWNRREMDEHKDVQ